MFTIHPRDAQVFVEERARRLRDDTLADRLRRASRRRRVLASVVCCAANRVDCPPPLAPRAA